jgi:succinoglycan biosynthesis transport protein ExoP
LTVQKTFLAHGFGNPSSLEEGHAPSQLSLFELLRVLRVRRKIILGTAAVVVVLAAAIVMQLTPFYTATAVVLLDQRKNSADTSDSALPDLPSDQPTVQNQVQILNSLELAGRVVDKLKLEKDPGFNPKPDFLSTVLQYLNPLHWMPGRAGKQANLPGMSPERNAVLHRLLSGLTVSPIGLSTAINVSFSSPDPYKAAIVANGVADAYVEDQLEAKFDATQKATQWLSGRIQNLSKQAEVADAAVQSYKAQNHITTAPDGMSVVEQQIRDVNSQLVVAKADLAEKQANYNNLASLQRTGQAANASQVLSSPLIATLRAQETDLNRQQADLTSRYLPSHPKILDLQAQKENLENKINEEIQRIAESVRNGVSIAAAHVGSLQQSLAQLESQGAGQDKSSVQLTALQSAATSTRSMYEAFLGRLSQTQGREGIQTPDARVISNAEIPNAPSFPKKALTVGLAIPAGLVLGMMLALLVERLDNGFRTAAHLESVLGLPVMSAVPEIAGKESNARKAVDIIVDKPMSGFAEAIRGLRLGLVLTDVDHPPRTVLVTSSVPGEGKTTVAIGLARVAAAGGLKTVVVDCDLRRPSIGKTLGLSFSKSIVDVLAGTATLSQCLIKDEKSGAMILPSVTTRGNPSDLLSSQSLQQVVALLREAFDFVIIDSPPVLPINDAKILSRVADAVLFVVRWEKTPREAVINSIRALNDVHARISGIALARVDSERFRYYSYGYQDYKSYGKYYSE